MSQLKKLFSVKEKSMIHYEGYIYMHTEEDTIPIKLIFWCQNQDCKGKSTLTLCLRETQISVLESRTLSAGNTDYIHRNTRLCMRETEISVFKMLHIGLKLVDFYNDIYRYFV